MLAQTGVFECLSQITIKLVFAVSLLSRAYEGVQPVHLLGARGAKKGPVNL